MKRVSAILLIVFTVHLISSHAQISGMSYLAVLDMPFSARSAGMGLNYLPYIDDDVTLCLSNPSLISPEVNGQLSLGYVGLFSGSHFGSACYSHKFRHIGTFAFGIQYAGYGTFEGYDEYDQPTGQFSAADYVMTIGWGKAIDEKIAIGANLKPALSQYEAYTAVALTVDMAATYTHPSKSFSATLMARNIGAQIINFEGNTESIPFNLSAVATYKLQDAPFRLFVALNDLQRWNLAYDDPLNPTSSTDPFTGVTTSPSAIAIAADNVARHVAIGIEASIKQKFFLRFGYNYRQMVEMKAADRFNTSGFSFGLGFSIKNFKICYSRNNYHLSQAPNYISITTNLERFF